MTHPLARPTVLLIGGSDSSGGAGLQADLRVLSGYRLAAACAISAVTAQNSRQLMAVQAISGNRVAAQLDAILDDTAIAAVKIGMLASTAVVRVVASRLRQVRVPIVLDPVLTASVGGALLEPAAQKLLLDQLLPLATVFTPNLPEVTALLGAPVANLKQRIAALGRFQDRGGDWILIKGGHGHGKQLIDLFGNRDQRYRMQALRLPIKTHGTGCTYASAIAAELALGADPRRAIECGHAYLQAALRNPLPLGAAPLASPGFAVMASRGVRGWTRSRGA